MKDMSAKAMRDAQERARKSKAAAQEVELAVTAIWENYISIYQDKTIPGIYLDASVFNPYKGHVQAIKQRLLDLGYVVEDVWSEESNPIEGHKGHYVKGYRISWA